MGKRMFSNGTKTATQARTTISSIIENRPIGFSAGNLACLQLRKRFLWVRKSRATKNSLSDCQKITSLFWDWRGSSQMELHDGRFRPIPTRNQLGQMRSEERRVGKECRSRWSPYH